MRFLLKIAFLLGLVALFLPYGLEDGETATPGLSPIALVYGAQQAIQDLGGFCERAPAACATGREAIRFAGERIGDGLVLAYTLANERLSAPSEADSASPQTSPSARDVVGSVERAPRPVPVNTQAPPPRPYSPPMSERAALSPDASPSGQAPAPAFPVAPDPHAVSTAGNGASPPARAPLPQPAPRA